MFTYILIIDTYLKKYIRMVVLDQRSMRALFLYCCVLCFRENHTVFLLLSVIVER